MTKKNLGKTETNFQFSISRVLIILILFFAIFFRIEIIQLITEKKFPISNFQFPIKENLKTKKQENKEIKKSRNQETKKQGAKNPSDVHRRGLGDLKKQEIKKIQNQYLEVQPLNAEVELREQENNNNLSRGSFTDLFSGVGWKNSQTSTVYQDFKTSTISFAPAYQWEEIKNFNQLLKNKKIIITKSNKKETVLITEQGEILAFQDEKQLLSGIKFKTKPQSILLDYDDASKKWIAVFISDNKFFVYNFTIEKNQIHLIKSNEINAKQFSVKNNLELSCFQEKCLITDNKKLWNFNVKTLEFSEIVDKRFNKIESITIGKADNFWLIGVVKKENEKYKGNIYKFFPNAQQMTNENNFPFFSSEYFGNIRFGYDSENQGVLAVYAAYDGKAFRFPVSSHQLSVIDFSRFFPIRVMADKMDPEIFYQDQIWWISSSSKSLVPKFLRISNGIGIDFTPVLLENVSSFQLVSGFKERQIYGIIFDGALSRIYRFIDQGFQKKDKVIWQSLKINSSKNKIIKGSLVEKEDGEENNKIEYFLTNDGGKNWTKAELNKMIKFKTSGSDFQWKVEFSPSTDFFYSPWAKRVMVDYYQVRN